jgi:NAD(P)-dependent dehydrogenase (short-subunit alcohol dehydrogenase family)
MSEHAEHRSERVVVVGGTSGMGLATAELLLGRGYQVVVAGRSPQRLESALKQLGAGAGSATGADFSGHSVDATDEEQLGAFFAEVGPFDHLVVTLTANGGMTSLLDLTAAELRRHSEGKLIPHLLTVKAALGTLRADGSVTLVGAISAQASAAGLVVLGSSNAGVEAAARILAAELAPRRVNAVSPGIIDTPWWDWVPAEARQDTLTGATANTAVGRAGRPEEVAHAIGFMIENTFTTGVVLPVDGGALLGSVRG